MSSLPLHNADAIVVGAGLCGSWVAKELTAGGMSVILIDAGPILPETAFSLDRLRPNVFSLRYHLFRLKLLLKGEADLALNRYITAETQKLFLDRHSDPYLTPADRDFAWTRVRAVGGRGHLWGRVLLRMTDRELSRPGYEWPVRYNDLAALYDEIERMLEMGGAPSDVPQVPDGEYVHKRSLHLLEQQFCDAVTKRWPSRRAVVNHVAEYEPSPWSPMLKVAMQSDRLRMLPDKVVASLMMDGAGKGVTGVRTVSTTDGSVEVFRAPFVFLAASAFESVRILLNSKSAEFPNGTGNTNGLLGSRILEHINVNFFDQLPKSHRSKNPVYSHDPFKLNAEPHGFYMPPSLQQGQIRGNAGFSYGVQGTISSDTGLFYLGAFGETVPSDQNRLRLEPSKKDQFGIPIVSIDFSWHADDLVIWQEANRSLVEMIEAFCDDSGIKLARPLTSQLYGVLTAARLPVPGSNHECGGARMGDDPATSVVDGYNRLWDAPNVLVCDTACFPSIPHQNPTLTAMALAIRASRKVLADG